MPFPLSLVGSFNVEAPGGASDESVVLLKTAISDWLVKKGARAISDTAQGISFKAGLFRPVTGLNPLVAVSSADVEFVRNRTVIHVTYRLRFTELLIAATFGVALLIGFQLVIAPKLTPVQMLVFSVIGWLWLFGMNYLIAKYRIPNALKKLASQATDGKVS